MNTLSYLHSIAASLRAAARQFAEFGEYRKVRTQLRVLPNELLHDMGLSEQEVRIACSSFAAWRRSRFGRDCGPADPRIPMIVQTDCAK
jgi:uncharacterized protein YjiS (DUF1127 family)